MHCSPDTGPKLLAVNGSLAFCKVVKLPECPKVRAFHLTFNCVGNDVDLCALFKVGLGFFPLVDDTFRIFIALKIVCLIQVAWCNSFSVFLCQELVCSDT